MARAKSPKVEKSPTQLAIDDMVKSYPLLANQARIMAEWGIDPVAVLNRLVCLAESPNYGLISAFAPLRRASRPYLRALAEIPRH